MKRNDIVSVNVGGSFDPMGRIIRVLPEGKYEVVDCCKFWEIYDESKLELHNEYKGFWHKKIIGYQKFLDTGEPYEEVEEFIRMPSLRKLKQRAAYYYPEIFKKNRKK